MENVTPRLVPPLPGLHAFPELNLRTYVTSGAKAGGGKAGRDKPGAGKPGVWFFSLDAGQKLAVRAARRFFHLPYFDARFAIQLAGNAVKYAAVRTHKNAPGARLSVSYAPVGAVYRAAAGTLDAWLTERYCLYAADRHGNIYRGEIDHPPWPLQKAQAEFEHNTLGEWLGIGMPNAPETLHFAKSLDVHAWMVERI